MTAQRTFYARNAFAAASMALIGGLAAAPVQGLARQAGPAPSDTAASGGESPGRIGAGDDTRPLVLRADSHSF